MEQGQRLAAEAVRLDGEGHRMDARKAYVEAALQLVGAAKSIEDATRRNGVLARLATYLNRAEILLQEELDARAAGTLAGRGRQVRERKGRERGIMKGG